MRTSRTVKNLSVALGVACVSALALACGGNGASNNDQGVSVTFLGLFNSARLGTGNNNNIGGTLGQQGCGQLPDVFLGGFIQLGEASPEPSVDPDSRVASGVDAAGGFVSVVGIQNNLYGQAFRADRVLIDYYVPGATVQPPSTNAPLALLAGPAESSNQIINQGGAAPVSTPGTDLRRPIATSLPPSLQNLCNRALSRVVIIPPAIREWLNFNRDSLPEAPFKLEVTIRVSGVATGGNRYETNEGTYDFDVLPETLIVPTEGTPEVTTTGGSSATDTQVEGDTSGVEQLEYSFDSEE